MKLKVPTEEFRYDEQSFTREGPPQYPQRSDFFRVPLAGLLLSVSRSSDPLTELPLALPWGEGLGHPAFLALLVNADRFADCHR